MRLALLSVLTLLLMACEGKKEIQLPKTNQSLVTTIGEHSPVYIFFKKEGKDTIADLNRSNTISSTHWIFNIDKRLPLRLVIPQLTKILAKKEKSMHKSETSENYFSYADSLHKKMAFVSFTNQHFNMQKPKSNSVIFFTKNNQIILDGFITSQEKTKDFLTNYKGESEKIRFCFDKNMSFDTFIQNQVFIQSLKIKNKEVFIY